MFDGGKTTIDADQVLDRLPTRPTLSTRRSAASAIIVDAHFGHTASEIVVEPLDHHMFIFQIGRETEFEQWRPDGHWQGRWRAGDIALMPAGRDSRWRWTVTTDTLHVYVPPATLARVAGDAAGIDGARVEVINRFRFCDPLLNALGLALLNELRRPELFGPLYIESLANSFIVHSLRNHCVTPPPVPRSGRLGVDRLARVRRYVEARLAHPITLEELAGVANLSTFHFARAFKASTGLAPHAWVMQLRLTRAHEMTVRSRAPFKDVALACGFSDAGHLSRAFRLRFGLTPSQARAAD